MELLGEEEYNPGVPVWRGEPQVRRIISMINGKNAENDNDVTALFFPFTERGEGERC